MKDFLCYIIKKNIFMKSAQVAFYFLLSLFPFIYIIARILPFFSLSVVNFIDSLQYFFPSVTFEVIYNNFLTLTLNPSSASTILYSLIALWSSSMLFNSLKVTFAESYPKNNTQNVLIIRAISIIITIAVLLLIVFSFFAVLLLNIGLSIMSKYIDLLYFSPAITIAMTIIIIIVDMVILYMILPPKRIPFFKAIPGAVFATAGLFVSSVLFSYYVSRIADYSKLYGAMGSVIVLLLWLYVCSAIIIAGGYINAYIIKTKSRI